MKKVAIYTRVSTVEQAREGYSLEAQRETLERFAREKGWTIAEVYEDGGYSGGSLDRPALKRLLKDIERGKIDAVVVWKLDRLTRSVRDFYQVFEILQKYDVEFISYSEKEFSTDTPQGRLFINTMLSFAQYFREVTADNIKHVHRALRKTGRWLYPPPFGYRREGKKIVSDEREFPVLERIFRMYAEEGMSPYQIAKTLNATGIPNRDGNMWDGTVIARIIKKPFYRGKQIVEGQEYPVDIEEKLPEELLKKADEKIERSRHARKGTYSKHPWAGILKCAKCSGSFVKGTSNTSAVVYFRCRNSQSGRCDGDLITEKSLLELTQKALRVFVDGVEEGVVEVSENEKVEMIERELRTLYGELEKVRRAKARYFEAFEDMEIDPRELSARINALVEREEAIAGEIEKKEREKEELKERSSFRVEVREIVKNIDVILGKATNDELRELVQTVFTKIAVHDEYVEFTFRDGSTYLIRRVRRRRKNKAHEFSEEEIRRIGQVQSEKARAMLMLAKGYTIGEVAKAFQVGYNAVYHTLRDYRQRGVEALRGDFRRGRKKCDRSEVLARRVLEIKKDLGENATLYRIYKKLREEGHHLNMSSLVSIWYSFKLYET